MTENGREDPPPGSDDDDATPAEFIDRPENLPGDQPPTDGADQQPVDDESA